MELYRWHGYITPCFIHVFGDRSLRQFDRCMEADQLLPLLKGDSGWEYLWRMGSETPNVPCIFCRISFSTWDLHGFKISFLIFMTLLYIYIYIHVYNYIYICMYIYIHCIYKYHGLVTWIIMVLLNSRRGHASPCGLWPDFQEARTRFTGQLGKNDRTGYINQTTLG